MEIAKKSPYASWVFSSAQRQSPPPAAPSTRARISGARAAAKPAMLLGAFMPRHTGSTSLDSLFLQFTQKRQPAFAGLAVSVVVRRLQT